MAAIGVKEKRKQGNPKAWEDAFRAIGNLKKVIPSALNQRYGEVMIGTSRAEINR